MWPYGRCNRTDGCLQVVSLAGQQYNVVAGGNRIGQRGLYRPRYVSERALDTKTVAFELGVTVRPDRNVTSAPLSASRPPK